MTLRPMSASHDSECGLHHVGWAKQDGCSEPNDGIDDTPEQAEPDYTCQPTNSCPNRPAGQGNTDPISNYMVSSWALSRLLLPHHHHRMVLAARA